MDKDEQLLFDMAIGVSLWVSLADGELAQAEKSAIFKRLEKKFGNDEHYCELFDKKVEIFQEQFERCIDELIFALKSFKNHDLYGNFLLEMARKSVRDDGKLTEAEESALQKIEEIINSLL